MEKEVFRISVRTLVEFILRSGDLDYRQGVQDPEAMAKGARIHRKLQKQMGSGYKPETAFRTRVEFDDLILQVEGRADGVFEKEGLTWIDEIKGTYTSLSLIHEPAAVHKAQAMCYACMLAEEEKPERMGIQMTYVHLETEEVQRFQETVDTDRLLSWFASLTEEYHRWLSFRLARKRERDDSIRTLSFPFPYRDGQKKMVSSVYHAIRQGKQLFVQAPTGVGKTMSVIYPAVRSMEEGLCETVFYLTAKTPAREAAVQAFSLLREKGLKAKTIAITAKEKLCLNESLSCNPEACPYAKGHYDRINEAVFSLWQEEDAFDRDRLLAHAEEFRVCPFELSLDLAVWLDAVICDYNYVFDPDVSLKRYFAEGKKEDYLFLVDEAHNLPDRAREMYSASLCREEIARARKLVQGVSPALEKSLRRLHRGFLPLKKALTEQESAVAGTRYQVLEGLGMLAEEIQLAYVQLQALYEEHDAGRSPEIREEGESVLQELLPFYFAMRTMVAVLAYLDDHYVIYGELTAKEETILHLYCANPAHNLAGILIKSRSTIFFSATLHPMAYYRRLLSEDQDAFGLYIPSPFPRENRRILIGRDVSTLYKRRGEVQYRLIARHLGAMTERKPGNYLVFFPSYQMLQEVRQYYQEEFGGRQERLISQSSAMDEKEREAFLREFSVGEGTLVAFAIMGGFFSEGIDLTGDRLIGAAVVGTGLPQLCAQREILRHWHDRHGQDGYLYAYRIPGMNKVLQAAGRVIRTMEDKGVILLLDERFCFQENQGLFPPEWADLAICTLRTQAQLLEEFWKRKKEEE
ncbi:MAG: ATP-dependent DNA helicase [Blautia sp.]|nr:ATP-dependent DNA helicase [Blautia sp.]